MRKNPELIVSRKLVFHLPPLMGTMGTHWQTMVPIWSKVVKRKVCEQKGATVECATTMAKDERIGVRVPAELKTALTQIAKKEGRSLAQLCEIILRGGAAAYKEEGPKYIQRLLSRQKIEPSE